LALLSFVIILAAIVGLIGFLETRREPPNPTPPLRANGLRPRRRGWSHTS